MSSRREILSVAAVLDVALNARGQPVSARALAERLGLPTRHLEAILRDLVHAGFLKGTRGPRGGYELARERRRISVGAILRALAGNDASEEGHARLVRAVVVPAFAEAREAFLRALDAVSIEALVQEAERHQTAGSSADPGAFVI